MWVLSDVDSGRLVTEELKYVSRAVAMDNLTSIVSNLAEIRLNLAAIERDTGLLQDNAKELQVQPEGSIHTHSIIYLSELRTLLRISLSTFCQLYFLN